MIELNSVQTRISDPAHMLATGIGHVSSLVCMIQQLQKTTRLKHQRKENKIKKGQRFPATNMVKGKDAFQGKKTRDRNPKGEFQQCISVINKMVREKKKTCYATTCTLPPLS